MQWVFGIVFLIFTVAYCVFLFRRAPDELQKLRQTPRSRRIIQGVVWMLLGFGMSVLAMLLAIKRAPSIKQLQTIDLLFLLAEMILFVVFLTRGATTLISVAILPESDSKTNLETETDLA